jgi:flagellar motility protein MotE (MotC chaperone)
MGRRKLQPKEKAKKLSTLIGQSQRIRALLDRFERAADQWLKEAQTAERRR